MNQEVISAVTAATSAAMPGGGSAGPSDLAAMADKFGRMMEQDPAAMEASSSEPQGPSAISETLKAQENMSHAVHAEMQSLTDQMPMMDSIQMTVASTKVMSDLAQVSMQSNAITSIGKGVKSGLTTLIKNQ